MALLAQLLLGAISGNRAEFWTQEAKKKPNKKPIHFQNLLGKMLVLGQRPKQVSKHSSIFKPGLSLSSSKTTANINCGENLMNSSSGSSW